MLEGDCNIPLEEYLKMVELRRRGEEDEDIGDLGVEGSLMTVRACVVIHPASQLHISPEATMPAPPTVAKATTSQQNDSTATTSQPTDRRRSNKQFTQPWHRFCTTALMKYWPRNPDGRKFMLVSAINALPEKEGMKMMYNAAMTYCIEFVERSCSKGGHYCLPVFGSNGISAKFHK
ncbi:hypothetical protein ABBQ32_007720 [Trebouxia sp. C0010 RCD-2024]